MPEIDARPKPAAAEPQGADPGASPTADVVVRQIVSQTLASYHHGPLPPASELQAYENAHPGLAERIVRMAEREQDHRHQCERAERTEFDQMIKRGQWFALLSVFGILAVVAALAVFGAPGAAAWLGAATIAAVVVAFLGREHLRRRAGGGSAAANDVGADLRSDP